uniref:Pol-like protein Pol-2 n=2 Tax=Tricholoma matsutake TaxID=40145 RepID=Q9C4A2_TRIMT|nr:Pol-like protein Pol-2 [Tricholoma matsutake]
MSWTRQRNLPSYEAISYRGEPCNDLDSLWDALDGSYNAASDRVVDLSILDELDPAPERAWIPFSVMELKEALNACSSRSAPGPDHVTWLHLKHWCSNPEVAGLITRIAEACITAGHWPAHFKESLSVIIPKPGKPNYSTPKSFRPIVLLNTLGKLVEKMLSRRLQFDGVAHEAFEQNQFGGVAQRSTEDAGIYLTHLVRAGWAKGLKTSVVAFDITQFFPSLNHQVLLEIISRSGFPAQVVNFFRSYLVGRKMTYKWNAFSSGPFTADVGVGQGSALSPVLSALYLTPIMKLFRRSDIGRDVDLMSYVDDGTLIARSPQLEDNIPLLKTAYGWIFQAFTSLGLVLKHNKSEIFHFSRARRFTPLPIDLGFAPYTGNTPLKPKVTWRYLGFFFDRKLSFKEHTRFYSTKALTTARAMGMLGNSVRGLTPMQKRLLYRSCVVPIMPYGLRLWHFKGARVKGVIKTLAQVQSIAACWILGAFRTTPIGGLESIAGLLPMQLLLRRLVDRGVFRTSLLAPSHPLRAILGPNHVGTTHSHELGLWGGNVLDTLTLQGPSVVSAAALALVPGDEFDPFFFFFFFGSEFITRGSNAVCGAGYKLGYYFIYAFPSPISHSGPRFSHFRQAVPQTLASQPGKAIIWRGRPPLPKLAIRSPPGANGPPATCPTEARPGAAVLIHRKSPLVGGITVCVFPANED